jgi:hypothetical protein
VGLLHAVVRGPAVHSRTSAAVNVGNRAAEANWDLVRGGSYDETTDFLKYM